MSQPPSLPHLRSIAGFAFLVLLLGAGCRTPGPAPADPSAATAAPAAHASRTAAVRPRFTPSPPYAADPELAGRLGVDALWTATDGSTNRVMLSRTPKDEAPADTLAAYADFVDETFRAAIPDRARRPIALDPANPGLRRLSAAGIPVVAIAWARDAATPDAVRGSICDNAALLMDFGDAWWTLSWNASRGTLDETTAAIERFLAGATVVPMAGPAAPGPAAADDAGAGAGTDAARAAARAELESILADDQSLRSMVSWGTTDPAELVRLQALPDEASMAEWARRREAGIRLDRAEAQDLMARQAAIDAANVDRLLRLVERHGWPGPETLGPGTPDPTAVLIHMPMDRVDAILPVLEHEVRAGRMPPKRYAVIVDRKRQHDGRPQLYGTAQAFDPATRRVLPPAIVDLEATNAARADIGLAPLDEWRLTDAATAAGG